MNSMYFIIGKKDVLKQYSNLKSIYLLKKVYSCIK